MRVLVLISGTELLWMGTALGLSVALSRTAPPGYAVTGDPLSYASLVMLAIAIPLAWCPRLHAISRRLPQRIVNTPSLLPSHSWCDGRIRRFDGLSVLSSVQSSRSSWWWEWARSVFPWLEGRSPHLRSGRSGAGNCLVDRKRHRGWTRLVDRGGNSRWLGLLVLARRIRANPQRWRLGHE
jgi:hypothetical protein